PHRCHLPPNLRPFAVICGYLRLLKATNSRLSHRPFPLTQTQSRLPSAPLRLRQTGVMPKLTVNDLNVRGKRVFVRVDYKVPLEERDGQMVITDATRIVETLPTLRHLIEQGGKLILAAHL